MFKIINFLISLIFIFYAIQGYAISPGAGQAQIRSNTQQMEQHKQWVKQQKLKQEMRQQQKYKPQSNKASDPKN
jgi:hypothetical protein